MSRMRRAAIMQPTYLPWLGYFDLMDQVEVFILLDDVSFSRQSWQQRNRVKGPGGLQWLTIPVLTQGRSGQLLRDVELADGRFVDKHVRTLGMLYASAPHSSPYLDALAECLADGAADGRLLDVTVPIIAQHREWLGIDTDLVRSGDFHAETDRVGRLVQLCKQVEAEVYVTPPGALEYLDNLQATAFAEAGIAVEVHAYDHPEYQQLHPPFVPYAAAVDALMNVGQPARDVMLAGRRPCPTLEEVRGAERL